MYLKKKEIPAYMTVEAAFIIPIAVCAIVILIYMAFHVFACCLLTEDLYILGLRGSRLDFGSTYEDGVSYVEDNCEERVAARYFGNETPVISAVSEEDVLIVSGETVTRHGVMEDFFLMPGDWELALEERLFIQEQVKHIRMLTRARDLAGGLVH